MAGYPGLDRRRGLHEPMDSCSDPVPIPACVIDRQAEEIARLVRCRGPVDADSGVGVPEHVNPIEWDDVIPRGRYILDRKLIRRSPALRHIPAAIRVVPGFPLLPDPAARVVIPTTMASP